MAVTSRSEDGTVAVFTLGGTISMTGDAGVQPTLDADQLLAAVPALRDGPPVSARSLMRKPGANLSFDDLGEVAAVVRSEFASGTSGCVVVQGTDTIEETAFALDVLLSDVERPVVVTGAMRNPTLPGADGPANLFASVTSAAAPAMEGLGVAVLMNDTIHAAARVQKRHASRTDAFRSDPHGPLGWFQEGAPVIIDRTRVRFRVPGPAAGVARVPLLAVTMDPDLAAWDAVLESGPDAVVVEAFGVGHVPEPLADRLIAAASRLPVVLTSRTRGGAVHRRTYGFPGSERHLLEGGLVSGGWLDPIKARVLAVLAVRAGAKDLFGVFAPAQV